MPISRRWSRRPTDKDGDSPGGLSLPSRCNSGAMNQQECPGAGVMTTGNILREAAINYQMSPTLKP
jgi:hypothetical protein